MKHRFFICNDRAAWNYGDATLVVKGRVPGFAPSMPRPVQGARAVYGGRERKPRGPTYFTTVQPYRPRSLRAHATLLRWRGFCCLRSLGGGRHAETEEFGDGDSGHGG